MWRINDACLRAFRLRTVRESIAGLAGAAAISLAAGVGGAQERGARGVGAGDLIQVQVYAEEGIANVLSGQFEIGSDGTINYPVLGSVRIANMATTEVAEALKLGLEQHVPITGTPAVSIVRYAPVYLLGNVRSTGPVEFKPGMTVSQLILSTGGLPEASVDEAALRAAAEQIADLTVLVYSLEARLSRLRAQTEGSDFSGEIAADVPGADRIMAGETAILEADRRAEAFQASDLKAQTERYDQEISSLKQTISLHDGEVALLMEEVAGIQKLTDRGLAAKTRLSDLKRELAAMQRQALEFRTSLYRVEQEKLSLGERHSQTKLAREVQQLELLRDTGVELTRAELKLKAAQDLLPTPQNLPHTIQDPFGPEARFEVVRVNGDASRTLAADLSTELQRGDIVRVEMIAASARPRSESPEPGANEVAGPRQSVDAR